MLLMIAQQDIPSVLAWSLYLRRESGLETIQLPVFLCQVKEKFTKYIWALCQSSPLERSQESWRETFYKGMQ